MTINLDSSLSPDFGERKAKTSLKEDESQGGSKHYRGSVSPSFMDQAGNKHRVT
jgi:hypothetical protein